jgi:2-polyprenyl-6-methoxyphenol hydroxylase-like FAD-dependent oxidoreductase
MLCDAAHLMPPFAGEGVNMAMLDAIESSNVLLSDDFENAHAAIAHYELQMRSRGRNCADNYGIDRGIALAESCGVLDGSD